MSEDWHSRYITEKQMRKDSDNRAAWLEETLEALRLEMATLPTACPYLRVGEYSGDGHRWTHCQLAEQQGRVAEAARAFAAVTLGLENTKEGAALLAALKKLEATNEQHAV